MDSDSNEIYFVDGPKGRRVTVPKQVFEALSDFMKIRKNPGSMTIHYEAGEVTQVETWTRKNVKR